MKTAAIAYASFVTGATAYWVYFIITTIIGWK